MNQNRPAVSEWLRWRHTQLKSLARTNWFQQLIGDQFIGKRGVNSTKIHGYREAWPELTVRRKSYGFESIEETVLVPLKKELVDLNKGNWFRQILLSSPKYLYY